MIEYIYAGPHGTHTPKSFAAASGMQAQAELGFIVVQMDGMGTSNRSKAFHDVAWQNIKDAGFPDRILWHQAFAREESVVRHHARRHLRRIGGRPELDGRAALPSRVLQGRRSRMPVATTTAWTRSGGTSSGWDGRSARSTRRRRTSSTRDKLQGKILLIVGELDTNVDPASTLQVVNALLKANKNFDFLMIPGAEHNAGRGGEFAEYGERKRFDFFVRHLMDQNPPEWSATVPTTTTARSQQ